MVFQCTKCFQKYEEADVEAYLCSTCLLEKNRIAAEIDRKRAMRPPRAVKSDLQIYDESQKVHGFLRVKL